MLRLTFRKSFTYGFTTTMLLVGISKLTVAGTITVNSLADLQKQADHAHPGDVIRIAKGIYTADNDVVINVKGSSAHPVIIEAEDAGNTEIAGKGGFDITGSSAYVIVRGFKFTGASSRTKTGPDTKFCRFTNNIFQTTGDGEDLTVAGSDHEIDHNTFQHKNAMGRFIAIRGKGKQIAERLHIHHNYFNDFSSQGGKNGAEAFQFGLSGFSLSTSNSTVEFNLFENCAGENELISIKASGITLRYNTIRDCPAQFTLRHGNKSQVYGNYFFNTPGLRIFGDDHLIYSNYFENCETGIMIGNGDGEVADGAQLTAHDRPDRILIAFNTLINNKTHISQTPRKNGMGATYVTVAYNLISGGGTAASISGPNTNAKWEGNIVFNANQTGDLPAGSYISADPGLQKDASGIWHLKKGSVAVDAAKTAFPVVTVDMDGQPRTAPLDAGADELSTTPVKAHPLQAKEVGFGVLAN